MFASSNRKLSLAPKMFTSYNVFTPSWICCAMNLQEVNGKMWRTQWIWIVAWYASNGNWQISKKFKSCTLDQLLDNYRLPNCIRLVDTLFNKVCSKWHTSAPNTSVHTDNYAKMHCTIHALKMVQKLSVQRRTLWQPPWTSYWRRSKSHKLLNFLNGNRG